MRTIYPPYRIKSFASIVLVFFVVFLVGCSGYQSVSYYEDGIYGEAPKPQPSQEEAMPQQAPQQQSGTYYKNYFADKATQGVSNDYIFTNPEQYQNPTPDQTSTGNYQAHGSWGDQAERINVNIIYNRPFGWNWGWGWYDAPFNYGRSAFWGYNYHPWYFPHNNFYNPYYYPYGFHWRSRWGSTWGYRNPWNYGTYWDRYSTTRYAQPPIYSRINGGRSIPRANLTNRTSTNNRQSVNSSRRTETQSNSRATNTTQRVYSNNSTRRYNNSDNAQSTRQNNSRRSYSTNNTNSENSSYQRSSSSRSNYRTAPSTRSSSSSSSSRSSSASRTSSSRRR